MDLGDEREKIQNKEIIILSRPGCVLLLSVHKDFHDTKSILILKAHHSLRGFLNASLKARI